MSAARPGPRLRAVSGADPCADSKLLGVAAAQERAAGLVAAPVGPETIPVKDAAGRVSAEDVASPTPLPPFDHSAMDGYALGGVGRVFEVRHRLAAGFGGAREPLGAGDAARIFTGAPVPPGTVAVAMQERGRRDADRLTLEAAPVEGANIRRRGEDVAVGDVIVPEATRLDARHVAILAAAGVGEIVVRRRVVVGLMSTGDELVRPGRPLGPGLIHDANRPMLTALLAQPAIEIVDLGVAPDDRAELARLVADASGRCDALVTSGATSVGEEDHLAAAVAAAGGTLGLARLSIKPGKPVVAGHVGRAVLIGLPGNPFAALVAWLLVGRVALERLAGLEPKPLAPLAAVAGFSQKGPGGRTEFAPARIMGAAENGLPLIEKLGRGGSARLAPLIAADGLAVIPAGRDEISRGDPIGFLPFEAAAEL